MSLKTNVMSELGVPKGYVDCKIIRLWENRYRVNVWVFELDEVGTKHYKIQDSFFVVYDVKADKIVRSSPEISTQYKAIYNDEAKNVEKLCIAAE
jgi:hypothetical protein